MGTTARTLLALGLCALAGCGGFHNDPLAEATIIGRVVGADASLAQVTFKVSSEHGGEGEDTFTARVEPGGHFELVDVPPLAGVVVVTASATHAAWLPVAPTGGRVLDLGDVMPRPGAFLDVQVVDAAGLPLASAELKVDALGLEDVPVDAQGRAHLGPLPAGCFEVRASVDDLGEAREDVCLAEGQTLARVLRVLKD